MALILSPAVGDSLLMMTIAHNLQKNRIAATVFGQHAHVLRDWFPDIDIQAELGEAHLAEQLHGFDTVIQMHSNRPFTGLDRLHPRVILLDHICRARSSESMADRLALFCRDELGLPNAEKNNGIVPPPELQHRKYPFRVAIHPTASTVDKRWLASRFIRLAVELRDQGFSPEFVVAPQERADWKHVEKLGITLPDLPSLDHVATWLFESGWFIGNDSGIGHLASSLQIPTISLFMRRGIARTWRPGWGIGRVLIGGAYLPTGRLRERYWKYLLSVSKVTQAFEQLRTNLA
ncbi:glycosyltransferase family 9 protein [Paraburkholderia susongensis]|uniref:glycosyltransferase family 9 protein n=1 Tax=Paraburkholderia susongensis TaxID=1515439 RepID=UPI001FCA1096|nr:glycosyltransferase family 9 protein [Paraburkholderia susongensis]